MWQLEDVTVFIPFLNGTNEEWLQRAISSLPQGTRYVVARNDGDLIDSLNEALAECDTEWVLRLDATDVVVDGMIENLLAYSFDADVVYPALLGTNDDLTEIEWEHPAWSFCRNRLEFAPYLSGTSLMRRSLVQRVGGFSHVKAMEDWDLYVRLVRAGARLKPCNDAKLLCRVLPTSRTRTEIKGDGSQEFEEFRKRWEPREKILATFYYQGAPAAAYLRAVLPARHLPGIATADTRFLIRDEKLVSLGGEGHLVMQWASDHERSAALVMAKAHGLRVYAEVDDNYHTGPVKGFLDKAGFKARIEEKSYNTVQGHRWFCSHANGVFVTTPWLAEVYSELNDNVIVAPNCVDRDDWDALPELEDDGITRVGWFASPSHTVDVPLVASALRYASRHKRTQALMSDLAGAPAEVEKLGWTHDISMYRLMMKSIDIGLAPVTPGNAGNGRSDIKATEYAMGGALPILSDVVCYRDWEHGVTCLKASTPRQFKEHVRWALEHPDERREIVAKAREWALANREIRGQIHIWREELS